MAEFLGTYDPEKVQIQLNFENVTGFAQGSMVTVTRNEDRTTEHVGTKGEVSRAINRNNTYTIKFTLQQTSRFNAVLNALSNGDDLLGVPTIIPLRVFDPNSYEQVFAATCWVKTEPERDWSNEVGTREWTLFAVSVGVTPNEVTSLLGAAGNAAGIL
jgi:hypothetical protein